MRKSDYLVTLMSKADEMLNIKSLSIHSPEFIAWKTQVLRYLSERFGTESVEYKIFQNRKFYPAVIASEMDNKAQQVLHNSIEATNLELKNYWDEECEKEYDDNSTKKTEIDYKKVFIVHGHNGEMKEATARLLEQQGIEGIILHEQPNRGKTIIEKFEENTNVGAAIILFTRDDKGKAKEDDVDHDRARQNVVFEAGYFMGKYTRDRVIIVAENGIEMPSDLAGVIYANGDAWKFDVCRELKALGFSIDTNKLM